MKIKPIILIMWFISITFCQTKIPGGYLDWTNDGFISPNGQYFLYRSQITIDSNYRIDKEILLIRDLETGADYEILSDTFSTYQAWNGGGFQSAGWFPWPENGDGAIKILYLHWKWVNGNVDMVKSGIYIMDVSSILNSEPTKTSAPKMLSKSLKSSNYPNPFNPTTTIQYTIPAENDVSINIYDGLGRLVRNLRNTKQMAGTHTIQWDGRDNKGYPLSSGNYMYEVIAGENVGLKRMLLLR